MTDKAPTLFEKYKRRAQNNRPIALVLAFAAVLAFFAGVIKTVETISEAFGDFGEPTSFAECIEGHEGDGQWMADCSSKFSQ